MAAKTTVSTPLDEDTLKRLDALCAEIHRTRAEVLRGLLYSLLLPEKYFIIDEWREIAKTNAGTPA
jgi:predicted transcriptional regulator